MTLLFVNPTGFSLRSATFLIILMALSSWSIAQDCDCEKFIYLNEPNEDVTIKFSINADGSLTEVLNPTTGGHFQDGTTLFPHGGTIDHNGYVYIGNFPHGGTTSVGGVDKYDCDGNLVEADAVPPASGNGTDGVSGFATNIYVIGNILYMNAWVHSGYSDGRVFAYDLCSGDIIGYYDLCADNLFWGFHIDPDLNMIFIMKGGTGIYYGDLDTYLNDGTNNAPCIPDFIPDNTVNRGIVTDENGCVYARDFNGAPQYIKKYCPDGNGGYSLVWQTDMTTAAAAAGFPSNQGGIEGYGLTYCDDNGYIYTAGNDADCVSVYDATTGEYVIQGYPNPGGTFAKEISIVEQCCITNTNIAPTDIVVCVTSQEDILLANYSPCTGVPCGGTWSETSDPDGAFAFDPCDFSVVPSGAGCATYEFTQSCGPATVQVNVCTEELTATISSSTDESCPAAADGTATAEGSGVSGTVTYEWSTGATSASVSSLAAGTYMVTVSSESGCVEVLSVTINTTNPLCCTNPNPPVIGVTNNTCPSTTDGSFNIVTDCTTGSTLEWSSDGGNTWVAAAPAWADGVSVVARCVDDGDPTCLSNNTSPVIAVLQDCCPDPNCFNISISNN